MICFSADFCGPCKAMKPTILQIAQENSDKIEVDYVNIEEDPDMAKQFGVRGVPTYVIVKDKQEVGRIVGATTKEKVLEKLSQHISN